MGYNGRDVQVFTADKAVAPTNRFPVDALVSSGGALVTVAFDYVAATYPDTVTEVYTFKTGGSGGTTVATVTVVYTTSSKAFISTVTKV